MKKRYLNFQVFGVFIADTPIATAHALYKQLERGWNVRELCLQLAKAHHIIAVRRKTVAIVNHTGSVYVFLNFSILSTGCGQGKNH